MSERTSPARFRRILSRVSRVRLVVVGDLVADEFIYGRIDRVSREAPVLILRYDSTEIVPGGAGNAASNAAALGARVEVIGVAGSDDAGRRLIESMPKRAKLSAIARPARYVTPVKTRILAGGIHSAKQQVVRIDRAGSRPGPEVLARLERALVRAVRRADAVIVSDYGGGVATPAFWQRALAAARPKRPPLVLIDSRYSLTSFTGMTACTPNEAEVEAVLGIRINDDRALLEQAGRQLLTRLRCRAVLITRGGRGMALFEAGKATDHIPIVGSDEVADVTGAGDTVIATFAVALAAGASFGEAARLANYAGGLVVMKRGTATVSASELRDTVR
jgi:rfaE bifunctional protein kinase chain/domain